VWDSSAPGDRRSPRRSSWSDHRGGDLVAGGHWATIACGYIRAAFTLAVVTVLVLTLVDRLELHSRWFSRGVHAPGNRRE